MSSDCVLQGALPVGSLQQACMELWCSAGYRLMLEERSYLLSVDDPGLDLVLVRPQEIPRYVAEGRLDFGICGFDCMVECECESRVVEMAELVFSKVSRKPTLWVLAVPVDSPIREVSDLQGKSIDAEFVTMTRRWLQQQNVEATVRFSWGATEVKPGRFCDAIVEATETGRSLRRNGLRVIAEVLRSTPRFISRPEAYADPWKREKMEDIVIMLQGTLAAEGKVGLMMNVREENFPAVVKLLPALHAPTVAPLAEPGWVAVSTIVDETVVRVIIPRLKQTGAEGIVEFPVSKIVP